jgi:hypothetical protein
LDLWERPPKGLWKWRSRLLQRGDRFSRYSAFHNGLAWGPDGSLHLSTGLFLTFEADAGGDIREHSGKYQGIGYLYSPDGGVSWERSDGTKVELPSTPETLELLEEKVSNQPKPGLTHGGITVNSRGQVFLGYTGHNPNPGEAFLMRREGNSSWVRMPLHEAVAANWPGHGLTTVRLTTAPDDTLCLLGELVPLEHPDANWNPGIHGRPAFWLRSHPELHRIVWLESRDGGETFRSRDIIPRPAEGKGQHMATLERPEGSNHLLEGRLPGVLYFEGESDYPPEGVTVQNEVYFVQP